MGFVPLKMISKEFVSRKGFPVVAVVGEREQPGKLFLIRGKKFLVEIETGGVVTGFKIPEFTLNDIPDGELVWCRTRYSPKWTLKVHRKKKQKQEHYFERQYLVPLVLAKDEAAAERNKNWWRWV